MTTVYRCPEGEFHKFAKKRRLAITWVHGIPWITRKAWCTKCRRVFPRGIIAE